MQKLLRHIFTFLILCLIGPVSSYGWTEKDSGRVTLKFNQEPLRNVLKEITRQSQIQFVYIDDLVDKKNVTCNLEKYRAEIAIQRILSGFDIGYRIFPSNTVSLFRKIRIVEKPKNEIKPKEELVPVTPPELRVKVKPQYPLKAQKEGMEGRVNLDLLINENGLVQQAKITRSAGEALLDSAAVEYAKRLKFYPATRNGRPTDVWLSWHVNYKSRQTSLLESRYIDRIQRLHRLSDQYSDTTQKKILGSIINTHKMLIDYFLERPNLSYNDVVKEVVLEEIYQKWKAYWHDWHLHFVVFQDYLLRYPNSEFASRAASELIYYFQQDLSSIKKRLGTGASQNSKIDYLESKLKSCMQENSNHAEKESAPSDNKEPKNAEKVN